MLEVKSMWTSVSRTLCIQAVMFLSCAIGVTSGPAVLISVSFPTTQDPQQRSREMVEIRIREPEWTALLDRLRLNTAQVETARQAYAAYQKGLAELDGRIMQRALREIGVEDLSQAPQVLRSMDPADQAAFTQRLQRLVRGSRGESDALRQTLLGMVKEALNDEQAARWPGAVLALKRAIMLNPRLDPRSANVSMNLGVHIDLMTLVEEAATPEGELASLLAAPDPAPAADDPWHERHAEAVRALDDYQARLDALLDAEALTTMDALQDLRAAAMGGDMAAVARLHKRMWSYRERLYRLNESAAAQLARGLEQLGEPHNARRWLERVYAAHFPEIHRAEFIDHLADRLLRDATMDEAAKSHVREIMAQHERTRDALRAQLRAAVLKVHETASPYLPPDASLLREFDGLITRWSEQHAGTIAQLRGAATPEARAAMDQFIESNESMRLNQPPSDRMIDWLRAQAAQRGEVE